MVVIGEIKPSRNLVATGVRFHIQEWFSLSETQTVQLPREVEKELKNLRGFRVLVAERTGYMFGAKAKGQEMSDKTEKERNTANETSKNLKKAITQLIEEPTKAHSKAVQNLQVQLEKDRGALKEARSPFTKKIAPLRRAMGYIDTVAIPDALAQLGHPVQPRFSLSEWITTALANK